ncbi:hypothetical protein A1O1_06962 [Capronia coronata CBS 617.96]|uniref:Auxin efflux carrier n=1 Tax=Capronia coronata CBS 617.96 TaxID=1182541 RepID=W9Y2A9_9EURO|nr:uncharacterized protein A1O1_06962 [Capronia coronata CBS 617.96]EXJ83341.1 hypothetical protein A1O1_06962 [Capronia coronata CBS 617.96]
MAPTGLLNSFLAAIQASLSVLLVIFYGGLAAHLNLLNQANSKAISKLCVRMFLPALLVVKIGSELHPDSAQRYLIIFIWAILCHLVSFVLGIVAHLWLGMPDWTTVALMFNNTTSYPLLLIAALDETGILRSLIVTDETTRAAVERAKSYFLVFATVSSCLTFAVGPRLIDSEHPPEQEDDEDEDGEEKDSDVDPNEHIHTHDTDPDTDPEDDGPSEQTGLLDRQRHSSLTPFGQQHNSFFPSLRKLSTAAAKTANKQQRQRRRTSIFTSSPIQIMQNRRASIVPRKQWVHLSPRTKWWLLFISDFFNAPLLGAIIGTVIGLITPLHRAFFNDTEDGGVFTAWLTSSLDNIGGLFVPLPVLVAGVSLYTSMREVRRNAIARRKLGSVSEEDDETSSLQDADTVEAGNGHGNSQANGPSSTAAGKAKAQANQTSKSTKLPWLTVTYILVIRFIIWPIASIGLIHALAARTNILGSDPMLWFTMMLMPTGPPAMKLITLVQVSDSTDEDEMNIAKLLTVSLKPSLNVFELSLLPPQLFFSLSSLLCVELMP